jgi:hypothetical protein
VEVRDVAFGERDDVDTGEGETLEETRGVFLIAAEAVERVCEPALAAVRRDDRAARLVVFRVETADCASLETRS